MSVSENTVPEVKHVPTPAEFYLARCIEIKIAYWAAVHNLELLLAPEGMSDRQTDVLNSFVSMQAADGVASEADCASMMEDLMTAVSKVSDPA